MELLFAFLGFFFTLFCLLKRFVVFSVFLKKSAKVCLSDLMIGFAKKFTFKQPFVLLNFLNFSLLTKIQ